MTQIPSVSACALVVLLATVWTAAGTAPAQANTAPTVTNVDVQQRAHSGLVDVTFDLADADGDSMNVTLWYSLDGGTSWSGRCRTVTGDVGAAVPAGTARTVTWDAGADVADLGTEPLRVRVYADDGIAAPTAGFVRIEAGTFLMGAPEGEPGNPDETQHLVTLTTPFEMQATEVTNAEFVEMLQWAYDEGHCQVTGTTPAVRTTIDGGSAVLWRLNRAGLTFTAGTFVADPLLADHPIVNVTWCGAAAYCDWLSLRDGLPRAYDHATWQCNGGDPYGAEGYRLPSEAEWEYACRAGASTAYATGPIINPYSGCGYEPALAAMGWFCWQTLDEQPVGRRLANSWGLFDMHGNVEEWCNDWYTVEYGSQAVVDPVGPVTGTGLRVHRGGSVVMGSVGCRSANRETSEALWPIGRIGFRPVRSLH